MPDLSWMEKLIIGGRIIIEYVNIGLSCKAFFVLGMLHPFVHLSQIAENPMLSKSPSLRSQPITDPFTAKVEADLEPLVIVEPNVLNETESEVAAELVPLQEETPQLTEVEEPFIEFSVDL